MGQQFGTCDAIRNIRSAVKDGRLPVKEITLNEAQRLDTLAGAIYGNGRLWWILAAASQIGYACQCPPGTIIFVPELSDVVALVG